MTAAAAVSAEACIDIGTNSVLLLVARAGAHDLEVIADVARITRLGEGLRTTGKGSPQLQPEAVERTLAAVRDFAEQARQSGAEKVCGIGTAALREAGNSELLLDPAREVLGEPVRVISGEEEARLSWLSVAEDTTLEGAWPLVVADVGGGSTEIAVGAKGESRPRSSSAGIGCVNLTERYLDEDGPGAGRLSRMLGFAMAELGRSGVRASAGRAAVIGGTVVNLACVAAGGTEHLEVHGSVLSLEQIRETVRHLAALPLDQRREVPGLEPDRAGVIVAGGVIYEALMELMGLQSIQVSIRGARYAVVAEMARGNRKWPG